MKKFFLLIFLAAVPCQAGFLDQEPEKSLPSAVDYFYNLDFVKALDFSHKVKKDFPGYAAGAFYESVAYYQKMQMEFPRSDETAKALEESLKECIQTAEIGLASDSAKAHYYLGACYGFRTRVLVARGDYFSAVKMARRAAKNLKLSLEKDPTITDAYLGLGIYHYYMDKMPSAAKPFAYLLVGMWGDRKKGLDEMELVGQQGGPAKVEARTVLASVYASVEEKLWDKAEEFLAQLEKTYPANPRYRIMRANTALWRKDWPLALKLSEPQDPWLQSVDTAYREHTQALLRYSRAEALLFSGKVQEAEEELKNLGDAASRYEFEGWLRLREGNILDARGERKAALKIYKKIKEADAKKAAKVFIKKPYMEGAAAPKPYRWPFVGLPEE